MTVVKQFESRQIQTSLNFIVPGRWQHRKHYDREAMASLVKSIWKDGIINPPIVFPTGKQYELLAGERRWRASCAVALVQLGLMKQDAAIDLVCQAVDLRRKEFNDVLITVRIASAEDRKKMHLTAVVDNALREGLTPIEEAEDYESLAREYGWSDFKIADEVGKSHPLVRSRRRLLLLDPEIRELVAVGKLSKDIRVTEALLSISDETTRIKLAREFANRGTPIRAIITACDRTVKMIDQKKTPESRTKGKERPKVAIKLVQTSKPLEVADIHSDICLCMGCSDIIRHLAEELCGPCLVNGVTEECRNCEGLIEFVQTLTRYAAQPLEMAA